MSNWYLQNGKDSDVVLSTKISLMRNIQGIPFPTKFTKNDANEVLNRVKEVTPSIGYGLNYIHLKDLDALTKVSLVEQGVITPEFSIDKENIKAMLINNEENICIMLNDENHINLQVFSSGLELENLKNLAVEIDEKLDKMLNYACHEKYGYLTSSLTTLGTGMKASVMVHLPGLTLTGNINKIVNIVSNFGMNIHNSYGDGTQAQGDIYEICNNQTLGLTENEIIKNLIVITEKVVSQERTARKYLAKNSIELEDRVYRALGTISYATKLTMEETRKLLSYVKLGVDLGIITELDDSKVCKLYLYTKPANLQKYVGKELTGYERDLKRAEVVKEIIKQ